jgi:hypothetical protein
VIPFIEKTWFLWWIVATLVILRWFHLLSSKMFALGARRKPDWSSGRQREALINAEAVETSHFPQSD